MDLYINGVLRSDVLIETGGSMETESSHTATSSIKISIPSSSEPLVECDFIQFKENNTTVYSGTIMSVKQSPFPLQDLSYKHYELTISDNSELLSSVFVDMTFQQNATIMQIIYGNTPSGAGSEWYNSSMPQFDGIVYRLNAEGITIGTVDDFSQYVLSEPANLWGMYVRDALDNLSEIAGAWWSITPDKVFNMQYPSSASPAPINITPDSDVFDVNVSRDAFTLYSAVRVIGGEGVGNLINTTISYLDNNLSQNYAMVVSNTVIQTKYPINSMGPEPIYYYSTNGSLEYVYRIGVKGIDDNNANYDGLYTSGSDLIELKASSGLTFPTLEMQGNVGNWYSLAYYPNIPIYARVTDEELINELQEQRGGTGVIEQLIEDNTISAFSDAVSVATAFLQESKSRAFTIDFSTFIPGWAIGQTMSIDLPYYGVSGAFNVVSLKKKTILQQNGSTLIQYDVSASNVGLREKYSTLFYTPKSIAFSLGTDFPNTQSYVFNNNIVLTSLVTWEKIQYVKWGQLSGNTWAQLMNQYPLWSDFSSVIDSGSQTLQALTNTGKNLFANASMYPSSGTPTAIPSLSNGLSILNENENPLLTINPISSNKTSENVISTYSISPNQVATTISGFAFMQNGQSLQYFPIPFDRSSGNPDGEYRLNLSITQSFSGKWLTTTGTAILLNAIYSGTQIFALNQGISIAYVNSTGDLIVPINSLEPNEIGMITDGEYTVSYYIPENEYIGTLKTLSYSTEISTNGTSVLINTNIDHGAQNPAGEYDLILSIMQSFS